MQRQRERGAVSSTSSSEASESSSAQQPGPIVSAAE